MQEAFDAISPPPRSAGPGIGAWSHRRSAWNPTAACAVLLVAGLSTGGCGSSANVAGGSGGGGGVDAGGAIGQGGGGRNAAGAGGAGGARVGGQGGSSGSSGGPGGAGGGLPASKLGVPCHEDVDCGGALTCLQATGKSIVNVGGPAGGICTYVCKTGNDAACDALNGVCINLGPSAAPVLYCLELCTPGGAPATKCHARTDVGCVGSVCFPLCSSDGECPAGRQCAFNVCLDSTLTLPGDTLFSHCTPSTDPGGSCSTPHCVGTTAAGPNYCSVECVIGSPTACNYALMSSALTGVHGFCAPSAPSDTAGDVGLCVQQCDQAADCRDQTDPGLRCDTTMAGVAHGVCAWPAPPP